MLNGKELLLTFVRKSSTVFGSLEFFSTHRRNFFVAASRSGSVRPNGVFRFSSSAGLNLVVIWIIFSVTAVRSQLGWGRTVAGNGVPMGARAPSTKSPIVMPRETAANLIVVICSRDHTRSVSTGAKTALHAPSQSRGFTNVLRQISVISRTR